MNFTIISCLNSKISKFWHKLNILEKPGAGQNKLLLIRNQPEGRARATEYFQARNLKYETGIRAFTFHIKGCCGDKKCIKISPTECNRGYLRTIWNFNFGGASPGFGIDFNDLEQNIKVPGSNS